MVYNYIMSQGSTTGKCKHEDMIMEKLTSPSLLAAIYLQPLDAMVKKHQLSYVRYMDGFVIFTESHQQLKIILKHVYRVLNSLGLKLALAKTWLGRVSKGTSFLGYETPLGGVSLSQRSFDSMCRRFQGQNAQGATQLRLIKYLRLWIKWARSGVSLDIEKLKLKTTQILQNAFNIQMLLKRI